MGQSTDPAWSLDNGKTQQWVKVLILHGLWMMA
jgi:hypothetical protein